MQEKIPAKFPNSKQNLFALDARFLHSLNFSFRTEQFLKSNNCLQNPSRPNINVHILHTILQRILTVLTRRVCLTIRVSSIGDHFPTCMTVKCDSGGDTVRRNLMPITLWGQRILKGGKGETQRKLISFLK